MTENLTVVKEALDAAADRVHTRTPQREELDRSLRRVRRRRRVARAGKGVGVVGLAAASLTVLQLGFVSLPAFVPAVPVGPQTSSALAGLPVRGSLADDTGWLQAFREKVATFDRSESGGERWKAPSADAVDVLYAGDLGAYRIAVVETPLRWGAIESRQRITYTGVRGAAPDAMEENGNGEPSDVVDVELSPDNIGSAVPADAPAVGLVLGPASLVVEQSSNATVGANGTLRFATGTLDPVSPGVWEVTVPATSPRVFLRWPGQEFGVAVGADWVSNPSKDLLAGVGPARRTASGPDATSGTPSDDRLVVSVASALWASALAPSTAEPHLVWSGTLGGTPVDVVDVVEPSGGHVLVAYQRSAVDPDWPGQVAALAAVPQGEDGALAWAFQEWVKNADGSALQNGPFTVAFAGPADATAAVVTTADGREVRATLTEGLGAVKVENATTARFLDATGKALGSVRVHQPTDPVAFEPPLAGASGSGDGGAPTAPTEARTESS